MIKKRNKDEILGIPSSHKLVLRNHFWQWLPAHYKGKRQVEFCCTVFSIATVLFVPPVLIWFCGCCFERCAAAAAVVVMGLLLCWLRGCCLDDWNAAAGKVVPLLCVGCWRWLGCCCCGLCAAAIMVIVRLSLCWLCDCCCFAWFCGCLLC